MMERFGLFKCLPMGRLRTIHPVARLMPDRLVPYIPPMKIGSVEVMVAERKTVGEVWVSPAGCRESRILPKRLNKFDVVGVEGIPISPLQGEDRPALTDGNALELIVYLEKFLKHVAKERRNSKIKVAIGGGNPPQVSTVARLLGREVDEMVLIGEEPFLSRLAGQIMAETGLSVRIRSVLPNEHFQRIIVCGGTSFQGKHCDLLFSNDTGSAEKQLFPWNLRGSSKSAIREIQSFAAIEAVLMMLGGWDGSRVVPGVLSIAWVDCIAKLAREIGFCLSLEALDTPLPVGYNVNNL